MRVGVGVVGCGTVSHVYIRNLLLFPDLDVVACADVDSQRAKAFAEQYDVTTAGELSAVLQHAEVEIVVNLTHPASHSQVSHAAVAAGKNVYTEKPIALDFASAHRLMAAAAAAGVRIGVAPDTFLGAGLQAAFRLIEQGLIGEPLTAITMVQGPGPEAWHPNPAFLYQAGAGPLFDMGPYGLTALAILFGPVTRVAATARQSKTTRLIATGPQAGRTFPVETPTHYNVLLEFAGGHAATATFSCDSPLHRFDFLEVTGTEATMALPNPNMYFGRCALRRAGDQDWTTLADPAAAAGRGVGVLEMARALRAGEPHRACAENAVHILEVMAAAAESAESSVFTEVRSGFMKPALLPGDWAHDAYTLG